jgi:hypothetical protein
LVLAGCLARHRKPRRAYGGAVNSGFRPGIAGFSINHSAGVFGPATIGQHRIHSRHRRKRIAKVGDIHGTSVCLPSNRRRRRARGLLRLRCSSEHKSNRKCAESPAARIERNWQTGETQVGFSAAGQSYTGGNLGTCCHGHHRDPMVSPFRSIAQSLFKGAVGKQGPIRPAFAPISIRPRPISGANRLRTPLTGSPGRVRAFPHTWTW